MPVITLTKDQLKHALQELSTGEFRPHSYMMEAMISNTISGRFAWPGTEYVTDAWPQWRVIFCRPNLDSPNVVNRCTQYTVSVFSKDSDSLEKFLHEPGVVRWDKPVDFYAVRKPEEYDIIRRRCLEINPVLHWDKPANATVWFLELDKITTKELPPGLRLGQLDSSHADYVKRNWAWTDEETALCVDYLLDRQNGFPNSAVFDGDRPVAHVIYSGDGSLAMAFAEPDYRGQGLFQIVLYDLTAKMAAHGHTIMYGYVFGGNDASTRCFRRMGGQASFTVDWITASPASSPETVL